METIRIWNQWRPGLILMDLQMPVLDGYEATRRIKRSAGGSETVVIALTATVLEESRRAILAAGAADVWGKPIEERQLFDQMHKHLGVHFLYETDLVAEPGGLGGGAGEPERQAEVGGCRRPCGPGRCIMPSPTATGRIRVQRQEETVLGPGGGPVSPVVGGTI